MLQFHSFLRGSVFSGAVPQTPIICNGESTKLELACPATIHHVKIVDTSNNNKIIAIAQWEFCHNAWDIEQKHPGRMEYPHPPGTHMELQQAFSKLMGELMERNMFKGEDG